MRFQVSSWQRLTAYSWRRVSLNAMTTTSHATSKYLFYLFFYYRGGLPRKASASKSSRGICPSGVYLSMMFRFHVLVMAAIGIAPQGLFKVGG